MDIYNQKKYQLRCPKCGEEFHYDQDYYDRKIAELGVEIQDLIHQLAEHNKLPYDTQRQRTDWWRRAKAALSVKQKQLAELKAYRKAANKARDEQKHRAFRQVAFEVLSEEQFMEIARRADEAIAAYDMADTAKLGYHSSASGRPTVSANAKNFK